MPSQHCKKEKRKGKGMPTSSTKRKINENKCMD
jgi:hypothetical protein